MWSFALVVAALLVFALDAAIPVLTIHVLYVPLIILGASYLSSRAAWLLFALCAVLTVYDFEWESHLPGDGQHWKSIANDVIVVSGGAIVMGLALSSDIRIIAEYDDAYPRVLRDLPDPPGILFVKGRIIPSDALAIAIVGARHATHYGLDQAERLAGGLARAGFTVVSGLARGIDAAAHRGALSAGGRTIAILASGVLNIYPPENKELSEQIAAQGAVVSESPPRFEPLAGMFPQRNRIIRGVSLGVVVVEASVRSGALITARHAAEQGRDVFAIPGPVTSRMSHGCHRLIRDGAKLVETVEDVLEELGPLVAAAPSHVDGRDIHHPAELSLNDLERQVLSAIPQQPATIDTVIAASGLTAPQVLSTLSVLEMRRLIRRLSGNLILRL
jgi:DNA processing protein